jgi:DNA-binding beta-propeller fold protein YncE
MTQISTTTNTPEAPVTVGGTPSAIVITPDGATAYVLAIGSDDVTAVTAIDLAKNQPDQTIPVPQGASVWLAAAPDGVVYAGGYGGPVVPISTATNQTGMYLSPAADSISITPNGRTVYTCGANGVVPVSTATNMSGAPLAGVPSMCIATFLVTPHS